MVNNIIEIRNALYTTLGTVLGLVSLFMGPFYVPVAYQLRKVSVIAIKGEAGKDEW